MIIIFQDFRGPDTRYWNFDVALRAGGVNTFVKKCIALSSSRLDFRDIFVCECERMDFLFISQSVGFVIRLRELRYETIMRIGELSELIPKQSCADWLVSFYIPRYAQIAIVRNQLASRSNGRSYCCRFRLDLVYLLI